MKPSDYESVQYLRDKANERSTPDAKFAANIDYIVDVAGEDLVYNGLKIPIPENFELQQDKYKIYIGANMDSLILSFTPEIGGPDMHDSFLYSTGDITYETELEPQASQLLGLVDAIFDKYGPGRAFSLGTGRVIS